MAHAAAGSEGIAPGANLLDIDSFSGNILVFYHALDWAITNGADAVNYSIIHLQSGKSACNLSNLISHYVANDAISRGMFLVGVAGNNAVVNGTTIYKSVQSPGCATGVLTVGGIDDRGGDLRMYNNSGRGPVFDDNTVNATVPLLKPEIVAPAVRVVIPAYHAVENDPDSTVASGTSFAAPMVTGAAAVLLEEDGELDARELRAALLVGADWKGPVPCTSVQFEISNASDNCSHARQPTDQNEANGPESLGILNNVGFGVLNVRQSLDYVRNGEHIVSGSLGAGHDRTYFLKVDDPNTPLKVILSWNSPTEVIFNDNRTSPSKNVVFLNTGMNVACPGMDTVVADSVRQVNEFAVFTPARAGTCTVTVINDDYAAGYALASTGSFVDEDAFVTTWNTASGGETITIPLVGNDITVDWGDGNTTTSVSGSVSHTYADAGDHTVTITGGLTGINMFEHADAPKLLSIDQWGDTSWRSFEFAFWGTVNMVYNATDEPDLSGVTSTSRMFARASNINGNLSSWDVSSVRDMSYMFFDATSFDGDISGWNVSNVTDMSRMFFGATSFDGNISRWNVSQVADMSLMFTDASVFNGDISGWDVSSVTSMNNMFNDADAFNHDLNGWNVSKVTDMNRMFNGANSFQQNLGNWYVTLDDTIMPGDLSAAPTVSPLNTYLEGRSPVYSVNDTRFVMDGKTLRFNMANLPTGGEYPLTITATAQLGEVNNQNHTRDVTITVRGDPARPFVTTWETDAVNQEITIPVGDSPASYYIDWGDGTIESAVTDDQAHTYAVAGNHTIYISGGFERIHLNDHTNASKLRSIDQWGDTQWTSMKSAFNGTGNMMMMYKATDVPDLSGVQDMSGMFEDSSFNGDISGWNVSQVTDMGGMFFGAASFDQPLNDWNVSQVTDMSNMFRHAASFDQPLNDWNVSQVTDMGGMFFDALTFNGNVSSWKVLQVTDMSYMFFAASAFKGDISGWNVSQVTSMLHMFLGASDFNGDISDWNVLQVTDMLKMFSGATSFDRPLNSWNVSSVTIMSSMFSGATSFNQTLNDWNVSSVIHMDNMFHNATSFNQPLNDWNVSSVTTMGSMFRHASNFNGDISGWNVSQVIHMDNMFYGADAFNQDLDSWNTSRVSYMYGMFIGASDFNGDISDWNVSSVTNMNGMFAGASDFNGDISGWNVSSVSGMSQMFDGADSFEQNLGEWYIVPADTAYDATANTLNVTTISAQTPALTGHDPDYDIGTGDNFDLFNMTGNTLMFKATPSAGGYTVNVTAPGGNFGTGNHRVLDITVTGITNAPPTVMAGSDLTVAEGDTLALSGSATDTNGDAITSYTWTATPDLGITFANASLPTTTFTAPSVDADATYTLTLTASDGTDDGDDTINVTVKETSGAFITTWRTTSAGQSITIPVDDATGTYDVIWGDGTAFTGLTGDQTHSYAVPGDHKVAISGGFERIHLNNHADASKLRSIDQWGDIGWTSMRSAFYGASAMTYGATDAPDLSRVTDMSDMFRGATAFDGDLSNWNVSSVTDMNSVFRSATAFDGDLSNWNVSSVTDMGNIFNGATSFNQILSSWNVSSVKFMGQMFRDTSFDGDLSSWDVSSVTGMGGMFRDATLFNQSLDGWNVSSVTDMNQMFRNAILFNQPLNNWNVSSVIFMNDMFSGATAFDGDLSNWDVSSVKIISDMFLNAASFDQNLGNWYVVANATSIARADVPGVVAEISAQNVRLDQHTPMYRIVAGDLNATHFEIISGNQLNMTSDVSGQTEYSVNVTASGMNVFESDNNWHVLEITVTGSANNPPIVDAGTDQTVGEGDTVTLSGTATDSEGDAITSYTWSAMSAGITFTNASSASTTFTAPDVTSDTTYTFRLTVSDGTDDGTDIIDVTVKDTSGAFITTWRTTSGGQSITVPGYTTGTYDVIWGDGTTSTGVTGAQTHRYATSGDHTVAISGDLEALDFDSLTRANASKLMSIDQWGAIGWTSMESAFYRASNMEYRATDSPDLSRVRDTSNMFSSAVKFNGNISDWNVSSVTDMNQMFAVASVFNQNLNSWNVSSVTNMDEMFYFASAFNQDLHSWNTSRVTSMLGMFLDAPAFNGNITGWNTSRVTDMSTMFSGASAFNGDISGWDVSSVTNMDQMFNSANSFNQNLGEWYVVANATSIARADVPGVVAEISAQNSKLDGHTPTYGIGDGIDKDFFKIVGDNQLNMTSAVAKSSYTVNVTAPGGDFGTNNWRMLEITVTGSANMPPTVNVGTDQTVGEGDTVTLSGTATDPEGDAITSYTWSAMPAGITFTNASSASTTFTAPDVTSDTTYTLRLTASDGTDSGMGSVDVLVKDTSGAFITTWRTTSAGQSITIPVDGATGAYDVIWGDGTAFTDVTGNQNHTYAASGDHTVAILGNFEKIRIDGVANNAYKLRSIDQWGDIRWTSMRLAFLEASVMTYGATDAPDLSRVTDMSGMFAFASAFNGNISNWNVSTVTNMNDMFEDAHRLLRLAPQRPGTSRQ